MHENTSNSDTLRQTKGETQRKIQDSRRHVLYLTFDGVLEPLGQSQVLRYLCGLSGRGFLYTLISLERTEDLANKATVADTEELLRRHAIEWVRLPYQIGGPKAVLRNILVMARSARRLIRTRGIGMVHARAHVPALIAWYLRLYCRTPYLFDARGYWIDEKAAEGQWFTRPQVYASAKWVERRLFRSAAAIVTLTGVMADDLRAGTLQGNQQLPIVVIPTCADFDHFSPDSCSLTSVPFELRMRLEGKLVVGMMGAINASYCVRESPDALSDVEGTACRRTLALCHPASHAGPCVDRGSRHRRRRLHHHSIALSGHAGLDAIDGLGLITAKGDVRQTRLDAH